MKYSAMWSAWMKRLSAWPYTLWLFPSWKGRMYYLEDFFILPAYRKKGLGQKLFDEVVAFAKKSGAKLMKWQVLDWNEPAIKFYKKNKAQFVKEWWDGKIYF